MHFVVTRDDQASFATYKCVTYLKGGANSIGVDMEVERGNIVMCA